MAGILISNDEQRLAMDPKFGAGTGLPKENKSIVSTGIDILDNDGNIIGFLSQINRDDTRGVDRIRHLNLADAGRTLELVPHPADTVLRVTGFALYDKTETDRKSLLNRIPGSTAAAFKHLNQQYEYFNIRVKETHPNLSPSAAVPSEIKYIGCLLSSYSHPINLGTMTIAEVCAITVSYVV